MIEVVADVDDVIYAVVSAGVKEVAVTSPEITLFVPKT